uniref:EamA domain-containing protein n=1 Tax=Onchocerca volvulus TaxID=6282 RepID=A0A8R1TQ62_ONCVO
MGIESKNTFNIPSENGRCRTDQETNRSNIANKTIHQIMLNGIVMFAVAFSWALSTQFTKSILIIDPKYFYAPYFMVWFNTNFMMACYPTYIIFEILFHRSSLRDIQQEALLVYGNMDNTVRSYFKRTSLFLLLWLIANYSYSQSLGYISASATSSIMSTNTAMVVIFGWIILKDQFIPFRLISVVAAIIGVTVISLDKEFVGNMSGISLSILSALSAALYKVLFKKIIGNATIGQVSLFMSGLGLLNASLNSLPMIILVVKNLETFTWAYIPWIPLFGVAFLSMWFNFLINFGITLLHPLVISIGMLFGIPISAAIDIIFRHMTATPYFIIGALLILFSCAIVAIPAELLRCSIKIGTKSDVEKK